MSGPEPSTLSRAVGERLAASADEDTRRRWDRYLKGAVPFRGVPMAKTRRIVHEVWNATGADRLAPDVQVDVALAQFAQPYCEDKLAGVLVLSERLLGHLRVEHLPALARPFELGHIDDWNTCDWYCVKVLGRFVETGADARRRAEAVGEWRHAHALWQRRAAAVSFVSLAPRGNAFFAGFTDLLLAVCERNVQDPARFSQTSVGWLLRELSKAEAARVEGFVEAHRSQMSREAVKAATARLPADAARRNATEGRSDGEPRGG
jgi:3-methyladenine DNA glycosylase AlkD